MRYVEPVFRPPSEAYSLIIQLTIGCSQNGCHFCYMYKDKPFYIRPLDEVLEDFREARATYRHIEHIFLADGDSLIAPTDYILAILEYIREYIPECTRVTTYASPRSILLKSDSELSLIHENGIDMLFVGLESGSDKVLTLMNKKATRDEIITAAVRAKKAGFRLSVTLISGLGGPELSMEHAVESASALSLMKPDFIGMLTLRVYKNAHLYEMVENGDFTMLSPPELVLETRELIKNIDAPGAVFRSNHISNYVDIRGTFNKDRELMLNRIDKVLETGEFRKYVLKGYM